MGRIRNLCIDTLGNDGFRGGVQGQGPNRAVMLDRHRSMELDGLPAL